MIFKECWELVAFVTNTNSEASNSQFTIAQYFTEAEALEAQKNINPKTLRFIKQGSAQHAQSIYIRIYYSVIPYPKPTYDEIEWINVGNYKRFVNNIMNRLISNHFSKSIRLKTKVSTDVLLEWSRFDYYKEKLTLFNYLSTLDSESFINCETLPKSLVSQDDVCTDINKRIFGLSPK